MSPSSVKSQRLLGRALRLFNRLGMRFSPFLVVKEGHKPIIGTFQTEGLDLSIAETASVDALLYLQKTHTRESLEQWFAEGKLCFVAREGDRIVALMWADLNAFNYPPNFRPLENDEAYLFAAIADPLFRGKNVAPALRLYCYDVLRERGISKFYSYSDYLNIPARRFKAKLSAQEIALRLHVDLWGIWSRTFTLKRYD